MLNLRTTPMLWDIWRDEAGRLPPDAPLYVEALASRVIALIGDLETATKRLDEIEEAAKVWR